MDLGLKLGFLRGVEVKEFHINGIKVEFELQRQKTYGIYKLSHERVVE
jgi:hypothetical protein